MTKPWTFNDQKLADNFEEYVKGQLPWYSVATSLVVTIAESYLPIGGLMYDIGASTGNITRACKSVINQRNVKAVSIEPSAEMVRAWKGVGSIYNCNAEDFQYEKFDLCVCFLVLMFIPVDKRLSFLNSLMDKLKDGGCIVVVDKFCGDGSYEDIVLRRMTMKQKLESGESADSILSKELSLSGIQRPLDKTYEKGRQFFQAGEFRGYILTSTNKHK